MQNLYARAKDICRKRRVNVKQQQEMFANAKITCMAGREGFFAGFYTNLWSLKLKKGQFYPCWIQLYYIFSVFRLSKNDQEMRKVHISLSHRNLMALPGWWQHHQKGGTKFSDQTFFLSTSKHGKGPRKRVNLSLWQKTWPFKPGLCLWIAVTP